MSTTKNIVATTKTILTNSADWEDWNERFIGQAVMYDLLGYIQEKENLLSKPIEPTMELRLKAVPKPKIREPLRARHCPLNLINEKAYLQTLPPIS